jgi:hypothetical protein
VGEPLAKPKRHSVDFRIQDGLDIKRHRRAICESPLQCVLDVVPSKRTTDIDRAATFRALHVGKS